MTNEKPAQPDPLAAPVSRGSEGPIPHISTAQSVGGGTAIVGPIQIDAGAIGVYVDHGNMAELKALLQYAAARLDSGKVSPELRASDPIVRRVLRWIEIADGENARRSAEYARMKRPGARSAEKPS